MLKCRIRVGRYNKKMVLDAHACGKKATHLVAGHPICGDHAKRLATDNVLYSLHPNGARLPSSKPQKIAA